MKRLLFLIMSALFSMNAVAQYVESEQCIGGSGRDQVNDIRPTADSGLLTVVITTSSDGDFADNHGGQGIGIIKFNKDHVIEWKKTIADTIGNSMLKKYFQYRDRIYILWYSQLDAHYDSIGNYYDEYQNQFLTVLNIDGNVIWQQHPTFALYSASGVDMALDSATGSVYVYQTTYYAAHIEKYDYSGHKKWENDFDVLFGLQCDMGSCMPDVHLLALKNDEVLLCSHVWQAFGWWQGPEYTIFTKIDTSGYEVMRSDTIHDRYILIPNIYGFWKGDDSIIVKFGYFTTSITLNINDLKFSVSPVSYIYAMVETYQEYNGVPTYSNILKLIDQGYDVYFQSNTDTLSVTTTGITIVDHNAGTQAIILHDSLSSLISLYYDIRDSSLVFTFAKYQSAFLAIAKYKLNGTMVYYKDIFNLGNDSLSVYTGKSFYSPTMGNKYVNNFLVYDRNTQLNKFQQLQVINLDNGNVEFNYTNDMRDSFAVKYMSSLNDKELFLISDFYGQHRCRLGDKDISYSRVLMSSNKIYGAAYIDYNNNNQYDGSDVVYNLSMLESSKGSNTVSSFMYGNTFSLNMVDTGTWATRVEPYQNYFTITPALKYTSHPDYGHSDTVIFALHPNGIVHDLNINLVNSFVTRLGNTTNYEITYSNNGTHAADGDVKVVIDSRLSVQSTAPVFTVQSGDTLIWHFTNLKANEFRKITMNVRADIPPALNVGDEISSTAMIGNAYTDTFPSDNEVVLKETILGSYDPNDKVSTNGDDMTTTQIQNGDYITYVVRFQNTGNDTAFKVVILDTLSANVDWSSFQMVNASHNFSVQVVNQHILQFTSNGIILPPTSINEDASHGFVAYKVKPKSTLSVGDTIHNTAHIYFDYNAPVSTGTVNTRITLLTRIPEIGQNNLIKIYPNPSNGLFNIEFTGVEPLQSLSIFDLSGRKVLEKNVSSGKIISINMSDLASGWYTIILKTDKETQTQKIIIQK